MKKPYISPQLTTYSFTSVQPLCLAGNNTSGGGGTLSHSRDDYEESEEEEEEEEEQSPTWSNLW